MSIITKQTTINATSPTFIGTIPNGVCDVVIVNGDNSAVIVGPVNSGSLTTSNALFIPPNGVVRFQTFQTSRGCNMYGLVNTGGGTGPVSMLVSTTD